MCRICNRAELVYTFTPGVPAILEGIMSVEDFRFGMYNVVEGSGDCGCG